MRLALLFAIAASLFAASPQRIVSTSPSTTETLFALGLGPKVVGVTIYCKYPEAAIALPKIGSFLKPDLEAIVALHPDLVVVHREIGQIGLQLDKLHIRHVEFDSRSLDTIYAGMREIGKAAEATPAAEHLVQSMQTDLAKIRALTAGRPKVSAVFLVGHTGGRLEGLIAGGAHSYFSDLLELGGGSNIFSDALTPYPKVSLEEILSRNPDVIIEMSGDSRPKQEEVVALWQARPSLKAVANHKVFAVPSGPFVTPGPRAVAAARTVLHLLHPELAP